MSTTSTIYPYLTNVDAVGDVDQDGYSDFITRGTVFHGGDPFDPSRSTTLQPPPIPGEGFGLSGAGAGDFNADGVPDVLVGAPYSDATGADAGRVYVFFGGANFGGVPDAVIENPGGPGYFGFAVAGIGDVNGDGWDDIAIGAPHHPVTYTYEQVPGATYIYFGGPGWDSIPDLLLSGDVVTTPSSWRGNEFGSVVDGVGDVNGDGFSDYCVGSPGYDLYRGRVYVFFGGLSPDTSADMVITGEPKWYTYANDHKLAYIRAGGDLNGDGFDA